jgi:hypothetical protein
MVKVLIGWMNEESGTVELTPAGLVYAGPDPKRVRELVERQRAWYGHAGMLHALGDMELVRSLPYRFQGPLWAVFVDETTGLTQDQPPYDPWGRIWHEKAPK